MVGGAADLAIDVAKEGGVLSPVAVGIFIINRVTCFLELPDDHKILCVAALAELATAAVPVVIAAGSEVATVGASTPVSVPMLLATAACLTLEKMKAHKQCEPLVVKKINELNDDAFKGSLDFNNYIGNPAL